MYQYTCKVVLVGDAAVGKSCVLFRFTEHQFQPVYDLTIGVDVGSRVLTTTNQVPVRVHVWDTAGQHAFRAITRSYYRSASAVMLLYDVTRRETFVHLGRWLQDVHPRCLLVLVGNKVDLHDLRQISTNEGQAFAQHHGIFCFLETSAKTDFQIEDLFHTLVTEALRVGAVTPHLAVNVPPPQAAPCWC